MDLFKSLPKVELHAHLGGSARQSSIEKWLRDYCDYSPDTASIRGRQMIIPRVGGAPLEGEDYDGFAIVNEAHGDRLELIEQMVHEYLDDCFHDGIRYVELRTGGSNIERLRTIHKAMESSPIPARLIVSIKRSDTPDAAWLTVRNAVDVGAIAIDFCGTNTVDYQFNDDFAEAIRWAKSKGLKFVPHFAEFRGEQDLDAILACEPDRLGHCCFPNTDVHKERKIPIECCLASNLNTLRRDGHIQITPYEGQHNPLIALDHQVVKWHKQRHPFALCCDNVGLLQCSLSEIYKFAAEAIVASKYPTDQQKNLDFERDQDLMRQVYQTAWELSMNAVDCILDGEEVKSHLRQQLSTRGTTLSP